MKSPVMKPDENGMYHLPIHPDSPLGKMIEKEIPMNQTPISRTTLYIVAATCAAIVALILAQCAYGQEPAGCDEAHKILICHIPPGDPDNVQTICIDKSAWPAHEEHGDRKESCELPVELYEVGID